MKFSRLAIERREEDSERRIKHRMRQLLAHNAPALSVGAGFIGLASIAFLFSGGTSYHQLAIGILIAAVLLCLLLSLVEILCDVLVFIFMAGPRR